IRIHAWKWTCHAEILLPNQAAEQSGVHVVEVCLVSAQHRMSGTVAGRLHVVQELAITVLPVRTTCIAGVMARAGRSEIGAVCTLWDQPISAPCLARATGPPGRTLSRRNLSKHCGQNGKCDQSDNAHFFTSLIDLIFDVRELPEQISPERDASGIVAGA